MDFQTILKDLGATMIALRVSGKRGKEELIPYRYDSQTNELTKLDRSTIPPDTSLRALKVIYSIDDISSAKEEPNMPTSSILHDLHPEARKELLSMNASSQSKEHFDPVNRPQHYNEGKIQCIDAIEAACTGLTGFEGLCTGTAIKYIWRWKKKEKPAEDIRKAIWYLNRLLATVEAAEKQ